MEQVLIKGIFDGKLTFALSGDIDAGNADEFYAVIATEYDKTPADLYFDCAELAFIDSTTLGTVVKILKKVKADGRVMTLGALQPKIKKLFLICALDKIMEIA